MARADVLSETDGAETVWKRYDDALVTAKDEVYITYRLTIHRHTSPALNGSSYDPHGAVGGDVARYMKKEQH